MWRTSVRFSCLKFQEFREFSSIFYFHLRDKGIHITEGRSAFLSVAHSDDDLNYLLKSFKEAAEEMKHAGFFPRREDTDRPAAAPLPSAEQAVLNDQRQFPLTEGPAGNLVGHPPGR